MTPDSNQHPASLGPLGALPDKLQRELNFAVGNLCSVNLSEAGHRVSRWIERFEIIDGRRKIRVIKDVEELRPELDGEVFRDSRNLGVLDYGKVYVHQPRANDGVAAQIAKKIDASGSSKTLVTISGIEGSTGRLGVDQARGIDVLQGSMAS
jgi:hypothetical protein